MTLDLAGVVTAYPGFRLGPIDLSVGTEVLAVLGPSGCGKTTLLWTIAGLRRPNAGSITLDGRALDGCPPEVRRTGLVFQDGALFPHLTARENVAYAGANPARVDELAATFEIADVLDRRPGTLSGGERQRVAIARTLATDPDVLLLDEPLSSLDAPIRRRLRRELHDLLGSLGIPTVLVTHDQRTAAALGDRLAVLRGGRVEQVGPTETVLERPRNEFVARFTGTENVFEAEVRARTDGTVTLGVGDATLTAVAERPVGAVVSACVHPSRVRLDATVQSNEDATDPRADGNVLAGTVGGWLNEGDGYRVEVAVDGAPLSLLATVPPPQFDPRAMAAGTAVRVSIPPADVHLLGEPAADG